MKFSASYFVVAVTVASSTVSAYPSLMKRAGPAVGEYLRGAESDRSPCPALNALANHGYLPRDGKDITEEMFKSAVLDYLGLDKSFTAILAGAAEKVNSKDPQQGDNFWNFLGGFHGSVFGVRPSEDQVNAQGVPVIHLNQLNRHGAIEHDISLSRKDEAEGDNHSPQKEKIDNMVSKSTDGGASLTKQNLADLRVELLAAAQAKHKELGKPLQYGIREQFLGFGEVSLLLGIFGWENKNLKNGEDYKVPVKYVNALFREERLPTNEGWKARTQAGQKPLGLIEGNFILASMKLLAGWNS